MTGFLSRRALIGAFGASALLPPFAGAQTFTAAGVPSGSRDLWPWMRAQLVLDPSLAWLDTAGSGPTLSAVMIREFRSRERQSQDARRYETAVLGEQAMRAHLSRLSGFLGCGPDEVAFTTGAASAHRAIARGLDLQPGDEILASRHEHPAAAGPWQVEAARRGAAYVPLPQVGVPVAPEAIVGRYAGAITPRTRVLLVSHVQSTDGTLMPLREIASLARANNIFTVVDGTLAPGHVDVNLAEIGCDAYATEFDRWLNASPGLGALCVRRDAQPRLWPATDRADAIGAQSRYGEPGRQLGPVLEGLGIALELQQSVNRARIGARIRELAAYLRLQLATLPGIEVLSPSHPSLATAIVSIRVGERDHAAIVRALAEQHGVIVAQVAQGTDPGPSPGMNSDSGRDSGLDAIRISLHPGNDPAQIDRCVNALRGQI